MTRAPIHLLVATLAILYLSACAHLYHVQVGDIYNSPKVQLVPFNVKVNSTGVEVGEITGIQRAFARHSKIANDVGDLAAIISLFQLGPRTGNPVYNDKFADNIVYQIAKICPSGWVTGLTCVRENRKYPVISGEIVKITGFCMHRRRLQSRGAQL